MDIHHHRKCVFADIWWTEPVWSICNTCRLHPSYLATSQDWTDQTHKNFTRTHSYQEAKAEAPGPAFCPRHVCDIILQELCIKQKIYIRNIPSKHLETKSRKTSLGPPLNPLRQMRRFWSVIPQPCNLRHDELQVYDFLPQSQAMKQKEKGVCLKIVYIPNEIAIFHRDNDQQNHWV